MPKKNDDQYSSQEAKERLIAALKGARIVGHVPMKTKMAAKKLTAKKKKKKID